MTNLEKALAKADPDGRGTRQAICELDPHGNLMAFLRPDGTLYVSVLTYTASGETAQAALADWRKVADLIGWRPA